ncbi:hypothetical protein YPPY46_3327, partial [Yersinia pestis PY-46]
MQTGGLVKAGP